MRHIRETRIRSLCVALVLCVPYVTYAQILISEIAWMGTDSDANNEWVELYNFSSAAVDLTGWTIEGSITVTLSGTLPPHGVGVIERTDDTSVPEVSALLTYTGALPNEAGGSLTIRDASGAVSDKVIGGLGWVEVGGTNEVPKKTPQRTRDGSWVTAAPTPGRENQETSENAESQTDTQEAGNTTHTESSSSNESGRRSGGSPKSAIAAEALRPELTLGIEGPKVAYVNQGVVLRALPQGVGRTIERSLTHTWNFGDTYTGSGREVSHTFAYPGDYTVVLESAFGTQYDIARHEIEVLETRVRITETGRGDIVIENSGTREIDLGGFILKGIHTLTFPKFTFLKPQGSLTISRSRVGTGNVALHDAQGGVVSSLAPRETLRSAPLAPQSPSMDAESLSVMGEDTSTTSTRTESNVITIGSHTVSEERRGILARFMGGVARLLGL